MKAEPLISLVPEVGLEPTRRLDPRGILSPVRLPIPPLRHQSVTTTWMDASEQTKLIVLNLQ
jgi:hypothetical protein